MTAHILRLRTQAHKTWEYTKQLDFSCILLYSVYLPRVKSNTTKKCYSYQRFHAIYSCSIQSIRQLVAICHFYCYLYLLAGISNQIIVKIMIDASKQATDGMLDPQSGIKLKVPTEGESEIGKSLGDSVDCLVMNFNVRASTVASSIDRSATKWKKNSPYLGGIHYLTCKEVVGSYETWWCE